MAIWPWSQNISVASLDRPSFPELRKRTRIVVIDDDPDSFPVDLLRSEGYAIDQWEKVESLSDLSDGRFDIIFLDIHDVAKHLSEEDGLGIIEHIKNLQPSQIVVAFSGDSYDLSKNRFFAMADDSLAKPIDVAKCKELIDRLIEAKHRPEYYWEQIARSLRNLGLPEKKVRKLEIQFAKALTKKDKDRALDVLRGAVTDPESLKMLISIAGKIILLCL